MNENATPATPRPFTIFAFASGGLDAVMQLGVIHALLVAREPRPDMVVGVSAGAINAVALADILGAGADPTKPDSKPNQEAQMVKFMEVLEAFRDAPATILGGFLPDLLETDARRALGSIKLPQHFRAEREDRNDAVKTRAGIIHLLNGLLRTRVSIRAVTQLVRLALGWVQAAERPWRVRHWERLRVIFLGIGVVVWNPVVLSVPVGSMVCRGVGYRFLGDKWGKKGATAEQIIFAPGRSGVFRVLKDTAFFVVGALGLLVVAPVVLLGSKIKLALDLAMQWVGAKRPAPTPSTGRHRPAPSWSEVLLATYGLREELGDSYALKAGFVRLFDRGYYGRFRFKNVLTRAFELDRADEKREAGDAPRQLCDLGALAGERIEVVPLAADVATGKVEALPPETPVVDALMAACAVVPFFRAQKFALGGKDRFFIDAVNVANDPTIGALARLRARIYEECNAALETPPPDGEDLDAYFRHRWSGVRIYSVPLFPVEDDELPGQAEPYTGFVQVGLRALQLKRFQDALLEARLVRAYNHALPKDRPTFSCDGLDGKTTQFFRTEITQIAPAAPLNLNTRIPGAANSAERRELMEAAVAEGCRAMLETLLAEKEDNALQDTARGIREHQQLASDDDYHYLPCHTLLRAHKPATPWKAPNELIGPGAPDVCARCAVRGADGEEHRRCVRLRRERTPAAPTPDPVPETAPAQPTPGRQISFLFSGGVFRGVFQIGFANAMVELGVRPHIIAGASVGTIVGALTARVFQEQTLAARQQRMRMLAATFLAIDRFVLTDRFADFVRRFSIRAAGARFSIHDADLAFRRFDEGHDLPYLARWRRVLAGLERMLYLSPFELSELVKTIRLRQHRSLWRQIKVHVQELADRYGVGLEVLGSEPLELLIRGFILDDADELHSADSARFAPVHLFGTATNLTRGRLDILSASHLATRKAGAGEDLVHGLLASSAFPAVFRPRWSWEVFRSPTDTVQYCDGGVMDNLPLDAIVRFLARSRTRDDRPQFERRPKDPHLIFTASLEAEPENWQAKDAAELAANCESWTRLKPRATELRYNAKIDRFTVAQRQIRQIREAVEKRGLENSVPPEDLPLHLEVHTVKRQWLCGTFGFHPMLGYRRADQAASIAHGCASTLRVAGPAMGKIRASDIPAAPSSKEDGACFFRPGAPCPFAKKATESAKDLTAAQRDGLHEIYRACGRPATHQPQYRP